MSIPPFFASRRISWTLLIAGFLVVVLALFAPQLGLGGREDFLAYRLVGINRRELLLIGLLLIVAVPIAATFEKLRAKISKALAIPRSPGLSSAKEEARATATLSLIALGGFLVLAALPRSTPPRPVSMLPEAIAAYGFADSSGQLQAHRLLVGLLAIGVFSAGWLRRHLPFNALKLDDSVPPFAGTALLALPLLAWWLGLPGAYVAAFLVVLLWAVALPLFAHVPPVRNVYFIVAAAYLAALVIPGFIRPLPLIVQTPYDLAQVELHLAMVVQPSSALAAGFRLFSDITPEYGVLMPVIVGAFERHSGFLDVAGQVRLVQLSQVAFLMLAVVVLYKVRLQFLPALLPLAMVGPYLSAAGLALWHPNQSGVRYLGFPIGLLTLQLVGRWRVSRQAAILGFVGALLVLLNFETGIALVCGFGFYIYLQWQEPRLRQLAAIFSWAALGSIAALAIFWLIYRLGMDHSLTPGSFVKGLRDYAGRLARHFSGSLLFTAGSRNANLGYVPLALAMLLHGSYLVLLSALRARRRSLTHNELFVAASSLMLVIWLGYYFNFPAWWNLWIPLFLYGVVLAGTIRPRRLRVALAHYTEVLRRPWAALVTMLVAMVCAISHVDLIAFNRAQLAPAWRANDPGTTVSGILVPTALAEPLEEKAAYLARIARSERIAYSTLNADFVPVLSGVYQVGMQRNFWSLANSDEDIRQTLTALERDGVRTFLTDDPEGPLAVTEPRHSFQQRLRRIVGERFTATGRAAGWETWVAKRP